MNKLFAPLILFLTLQNLVYSQEELQLSFTPVNWFAESAQAEFIDYKGRPAVKLTAGEMFYKDLEFKDGTIEVDVEVDQASPFPTIYFRAKEQSAEHVYLRTGVAEKSNAVDAVQYASIIDRVNLWDMQYEFQSSANIKIGDWNHLKLVVSGKQLRVYVNNPDEPNLEIPCMEGNFAEGMIGIGTGFPGFAIFSNLVIKPNATEDLPSTPAPDLTRHDTRYLRLWQVSSPIGLPNGQEINSSMITSSETKWEDIGVERRGLLNLSRKFGLSESRRVVWLRTSMQSEMQQSKMLQLGFSDEVWVFLNGQPVYLDKNLYIQNMRKNPNGRISLDNSDFTLHLREGKNELLIAVANDFYGWGIMARLENLDGIQF